jgi:hypothetical protein
VRSGRSGHSTVPGRSRPFNSFDTAGSERSEDAEWARVYGNSTRMGSPDRSAAERSTSSDIPGRAGSLPSRPAAGSERSEGGEPRYPPIAPTPRVPPCHRCFDVLTRTLQPKHPAAISTYPPPVAAEQVTTFKRRFPGTVLGVPPLTLISATTILHATAASRPLEEPPMNTYVHWRGRARPAVGTRDCRSP